MTRQQGIWACSLLCVLALAAGVTPAGADANQKTTTAKPKRAASQLRDGPRRVPEPRGASLERARKLGLGSRDTAQKLLRLAPEARWVDAARAWGRAQRTLEWPVLGGRFGRGYGFTRREQRALRHNGIDFVAPVGTEVRAAADGIVAYSDNGIRGFGNCVLIVHPNGWVTLYGHNSRNTVQPGWRVRRGERIGFIGQTGIARGPHLHFELRDRGRLRNPASLLSGRPVASRRPI